ncbi:hypothetical protein LCGC14_1300310 [marine sediment metagenome]|uniref:Uncharacterized protein n=1 Tax=marine sediment metagenome TaxID=412755 RepID=A0A0F9KQ89_9ZZZZ|nr:hypothetical protein [bacterium]
MEPEEKSKKELNDLLTKIEGRRSPQERIEAQLDLIAGFDEINQKMLTLKQLILEKKDEEIAFPTLNIETQAEITKERIKSQEKFEIYIVDVGIIDKDRAIKEIDDRSEIGMEIIEIEKITVKLALENIKKQIDEGTVQL